MSYTNYEYIHKNYTLPEWFNYSDIDWLRYYPAKDGKIYECNTKRTIEKMIKEEKRGVSYYIYDDEKVKIHKIFVKYLAYINHMSLDTDLTDEEMKKLLSIKICDYDWLFMWGNPKYDKNSEELLLRKILVLKHNVLEHFAKKNNFDVEINGINYFIEFKKEDTRFKKPLDLSITRYREGIIGSAFLLEYKKYYHIRRRLYNIIVCINKLRDGLIRNYQVFNEFEIEALRQYLTNKNILFRIVITNTLLLKYINTRKYNMLDNSYKYWLCEYRYPEENKVLKPCKLYIEVYKGYINLTEIKDRYSNKNEFKHGIYLY